ncbi:hypothetical protein [Streptomyces sp. NPDC059759]
MRVYSDCIDAAVRQLAAHVTDELLTRLSLLPYDGINSGAAMTYS